jgi:large-conductance mechanosensitive channel
VPKRKFVGPTNFIELAVGVIVGAAFGVIAISVANDAIMPVVGVVGQALGFLRSLAEANLLQ